MNNHRSAKPAFVKLLTGGLGLSLLVALPAHATHKSWVKHDGGTSCYEEGPGVNAKIRFFEAAWNPSTVAVGRVVCPVTLGGRFSATGVVNITPHDKVVAMRAEVHYYDGSTTQSLSCQMTGITQTGSTLWSDSRYSCGTDGGCDVHNMDPAYTGYSVFKFADPGNIPGRRIGVNGADVTPGVRSLAYDCFLPSNDSDLGWSGVTGTMTQICQRDPTNNPAGYAICFE
jgi:hypothetical protein